MMIDYLLLNVADNGLFEMDPSGQTAPRIIKEEIGEFCGLNGMD